MAASSQAKLHQVGLAGLDRFDVAGKMEIEERRDLYKYVLRWDGFWGAARQGILYGAMATPSSTVFVGFETTFESTLKIS